jgi:hypothetical protein
MRSYWILALLLVLTGVALAQQQETNFPVGPQYLVTVPYGSVLQPIETPSISPSQPTGPVSPQTGEPLPITVPGIPGAANLGAVYWGEPNEAVQVMEPPAPNPLPQGFFDVGVWALTSDQALHQQGYGMTLVQAARYWKKHKLHAAHVYTNEDLKHLPQG